MNMLWVELRLGSVRKASTVADLAVLLGEPELPARLLRVLFNASCPSSPRPSPQLIPGEVGGRGVERLPGFLGTQTEEKDPSVGVRGGEGCRGEAGPRWGQPVDDADRTARYLADRLDDPKSLRWYRLVCSALDATTVRDALVRALEVPRAEVRRSRAALFTSLVRPLVAARLQLRDAR